MELLQVGDQTITAEEIIPVLAGYQMLPSLLREIILDRAVANIECSSEEAQQARAAFYGQNKISNEEELSAYLQQQGMTAEQLDHLAVRGIKIEKYKVATWGSKLESYFLQRKQQLDRVIYSLIRTKDAAVAQELYFRIQEGEQSFSDLAKEYSQGSEAETGGLIGPVEISTPHPILAQLFLRSQPGELAPPTRAGDWIVIVRLEKFIPAQLDDAMRRRLLNELFARWLQEEVQKNISVQISVQPSL